MTAADTLFVGMMALLVGGILVAFVVGDINHRRRMRAIDEQSQRVKELLALGDKDAARAAFEVLLNLKPNGKKS